MRPIPFQVSSHRCSRCSSGSVVGSWRNPSAARRRRPRASSSIAAGTVVSSFSVARRARLAPHPHEIQITGPGDAGLQLAASPMLQGEGLQARVSRLTTASVTPPAGAARALRLVVYEQRNERRRVHPGAEQLSHVVSERAADGPSRAPRAARAAVPLPSRGLTSDRSVASWYMVTRKTPRTIHQLLVQSRHKIAMSGMAVAASSPITVTWGRRIGGASDCNETDHQNCGHTSGLRFQERGTYSDARKSGTSSPPSSTTASCGRWRARRAALGSGRSAPSARAKAKSARPDCPHPCPRPHGHYVLYVPHVPAARPRVGRVNRRGPIPADRLPP
jgi:hypothetical protein